jgi:hypothetical protein
VVVLTDLTDLIDLGRRFFDRTFQPRKLLLENRCLPQVCEACDQLEQLAGSRRREPSRAHRRSDRRQCRSRVLCACEPRQFEFYGAMPTRRRQPIEAMGSAAMSPALAGSIARRVIASASPCNNDSAMRVALLRAPGRPSGFPLIETACAWHWPFEEMNGCG